MTSEKTSSTGLAGYLVVNSGTPDAYFFELETGKVLEIGRKPGQPQGPRKLVLPVPEVSSIHAELRPGTDGWALRDSGSTNGTRLNGNWLSAGQDYLLKNGDHIKIAQVDLIVNLPEDTPQRGSDTAEPRGEDEHERTQLHIKLMTATILVADIRGFTSLMEVYSDHPDRVMHAAQRVFGKFHDQIRSDKGNVEKIAGDAVMAYWQGEDATSANHSDWAYQACVSALRIKESLPAMGRPEEWPFQDHPLQVDIALATGPVAAGVLGAGKSSLAVLGDTANLAFRLEKLIGDDRAGDIIIDGPTFEHVKGRFETESMGPVTVKGRQRPVEVYRLLGKKG